jgi:hypothetical protein
MCIAGLRRDKADAEIINLLYQAALSRPALAQELETAAGAY